MYYVHMYSELHGVIRPRPSDVTQNIWRHKPPLNREGEALLPVIYKLPPRIQVCMMSPPRKEIVMVYLHE